MSGKPCDNEGLKLIKETAPALSTRGGFLFPLAIIPGPAGVEGAQVQAVDRVADEVGQVPLGQPVLQRLPQQ